MTHVDLSGLEDCQPPTCLPMPEGDPKDIITGPPKPPPPEPPTPQSKTPDAPIETIIDETGAPPEPQTTQDASARAADRDKAYGRGEKVPNAEGGPIKTVVDLGKSKAMVYVGQRTGRAIARSAAERAVRQGPKVIASEILSEGIAKSVYIGRRFGGIVGLALDYATSPGGDTSLPVPVYQAVRTDEVMVPDAAWHQNRADAEDDARAYTAATGILTYVDVSTLKNLGGLPDPPAPSLGLGELLVNQVNRWMWSGFGSH